MGYRCAYLEGGNNLGLVEHDERVKSRHHVLFKEGRGGENHLLDILHLVCLVDLCKQLRAIEGNHLSVL